MALERRNPLPLGIYWVDAFQPPVGGNSIDAVLNWVKENRGAIVVLKTVYHGPGADPFIEFARGGWTLSPQLAAAANLLPDSGRARAWILFEVKKPVLWPAVQFGFPTIASETTNEEDTVQKPDPEKNVADIVPPVDQLAKSGGKIALIVGGIAAAALGVYIAVQTYFVRKLV